jgi:mannose-6-phosphate isomerase-like protein (cupin superfamily)
VGALAAVIPFGAMKALTLVAMAVLLLIPISLRAQQSDPPPSCKNCPGYYIPTAELDTYLKRAIAERIIDQQVRSVNVGKSNVAIGMVHRTKASIPSEVAEHDLVSEVYHIISGSATLVLGPELVDAQRRPATNQNVRELNGPGHNAKSIRNGVPYDLKAGDVVIIPAGTGHWFTKIDDHITYLMIRVDPDKVTPEKLK